MSGFLKRQNNTVNPAGGINPAQEPNVGQYGWTNYDAANVNQLIQYVDMCRGFAESSRDSAAYVGSKFGELEAFIKYIEVIYKEIGPIFDNIDALYKDVVLKHTEVTNMYTDVQGLVATTLGYRDEAQAASAKATAEASKALASATASETSATASEASKVGAESAAKDAAEVAEELRKGQVYRGTWNIEANAGYPSAPDTNSVWDVTLNPGSVEYTFDNTRWFWGNRLLYLKDDNKFSQIESGSGVLSVNGKTGAVTLIASDVGAYSVTGGAVTGSIHANAPSKQITFKSPNNYISMGGDDLYLAAINGETSRVVLQSFRNPLVSIATTPGSPTVNNYEIYHKGNKPTAEEVGAVGKIGNQSVTGDFTAVQFKASDSCSFVSSVLSSHGMFLGKGANDRRTIIGGGGAVTGDKTGTIHLRPNGIGDTSGEVVVTVDGNISSAPAPTSNSHLTNKVYVDGLVGPVKTTADSAKITADAAMPKSGGAFTGPVTAVVAKSAMTFANKSSIRYYDGNGTHFHNFAEGNAVYWKTGTSGENACAYLTSAGIFNTEGVVYSKTGTITQSRNGASWLGMEAPETGAPYISSKAEGETNTILSMRFGKSEISVESGKKLTANHIRVGADGGLQFSADAAMSGITWAMGVNPTNRNFGIYQYNNGAYGGQYINIDPSNGGGTTLLGRRVKITGNTQMSGYAVIEGAGNNGLEFHQPGNTAAFIYKPMGRAALRFSASNGIAGETDNYLDLVGSQATFKGKVVSNHSSSRGWNQTGDSVFYGGASTMQPGALSSLASQWITVPGMAAYEHGMGLLSTSSSDIGTYGNALYCQDGGGYVKYWVFQNNGNMVSPSGLRISGDGLISGDAYAGYENSAQWIVASVAATSDERLKTVVGDSVKSALDVVNQFQFKRFVWNEDAGKIYHERHAKVTEIGLIAQQVESVEPVLVKTITTGGDNPSETKTLDTAAMLALAMKAIQEQQIQINELKEKLNEYVLN